MSSPNYMESQIELTKETYQALQEAQARYRLEAFDTIYEFIDDLEA